LKVTLEKLFYPNTIAVIGASPGKREDRWDFFKSIIEGGFPGNVYPVNPRYKEIHGREAYASVLDIPDDVDLAIIVVGRDRVLQVVKNCVKKNVKFIHIFTSGFGETGKSNLERELIKATEGSNTRIVGPNCIGICCPEAGIRYRGLTKISQGNLGDIAFFSQSGDFAATFALVGESLGIPANKIVSLGNQADISLDEYLDYFADDHRINIICGYIEGLKDGKRFFDSLKKATSKKPVVIWKGGTTDTGARTAQSHTGSLATSYQIWESIIRQTGIICVNSFDEMFDIISLLKLPQKPSGLRAGLVLGGGGASVVLSDSLTSQGIELPVLNPKLQKDISKLIKEGVNSFTINPVDLGMFAFSTQIILEALQIASCDKNIDFLLLHLSAESYKLFDFKDAWHNLVKLLKQRRTTLSKPIAVMIPHIIKNDSEIFDMRSSAEHALRRCGIPVFPSPERLGNAFKKLYLWQERFYQHKIPVHTE